MKELEARFPKGVEYRIVYDTTVFRAGIDQKRLSHPDRSIPFWSSSWCWSSCKTGGHIIPMVAVPVSLIGTFPCMAMLGFSANNLSLFRAGAGHRHRGR